MNNPEVMISKSALESVVEKGEAYDCLKFDLEVKNNSDYSISWISFDAGIKYTRTSEDSFTSSYIQDGNTRYSTSKFRKVETNWWVVSYSYDRIIPPFATETIKGNWYRHDGVVGKPGAEPFLKKAYGKFTNGEAFVVDFHPDVEIIDGRAFKSTSERISGCFVATWAFEDENHVVVERLRKFRDEVLLKSVGGRFFVSAYYFASPTVVTFFKGIGFPKPPIRIFLSLLARITPK